MNEPWLMGDEEGCLGGPQGQGVYDINVSNIMWQILNNGMFRR